MRYAVKKYIERLHWVVKLRTHSVCMSCFFWWKSLSCLWNENDNVKSIHEKVCLFDSTKNGLQNSNYYLYVRSRIRTYHFHNLHSKFCCQSNQCTPYMQCGHGGKEWGLQKSLVDPSQKKNVIRSKSQEYSLSLCMCIFCLLLCFVLIHCYPVRDSGLNGISLFQQFKDKGMIQYMHNLIPFYSFCCNKWMYKSWHAYNMQNTHPTKMCTFVAVIPCLYWSLSWGKDSISTAWHNRSLKIYKLIKRTGLLFLFLWSVLQRLVQRPKQGSQHVLL